MNKSILIIDSNYLCHRSMMRMLGFSYEDIPTGVIFGFLRSLQQLHEKFNPTKVVFAWDSNKSFRKEVYSDYKKKTPIEEEKEDIAQALRLGLPQFAVIRKEILPRLGFKNSFIQTGIESDDIMAIIARDYAPQYQITIVTGDHDLYQTINNRVSIYHPIDKKLVTIDSFTKEMEIRPNQWAWVKAVAGCSSDNVRGIRGVGEKSAIKYLNGKLKGIKKDAIFMYDPTPNLLLVSLPFPKTHSVELVEDELDMGAFEGVCLDFGLQSLLKRDSYNKWRKILSKIPGLLEVPSC
jgi:5'-3' exonuclease